MSLSAPAAQSMVNAMAEQALTEGVFGQYEIKKIRISPDNRKRFNEQALQELAASIDAVGVAQPILIRPVDPTPEAPEEFEIVAGERRFRASKIAGKETIPALCRNLSNLEAAKLRILENLQREDPHPLEEAEGYQLLMLQHGFTADQLADEVKKSKAYVYARLKLCALSPEAREPFLRNQISASTALLVARIPVPKLQVQALKEILQPTWPDQEPMSYRQAVKHIQGRYTLDLGHAVFKLTDSKLLVSAGACSKCPKRTGNQRELYPDVSADVCTDPDCYSEKEAAHYAATIVEANKNGIPIIDGEEGAELIPSSWESDSEFVVIDQALATFKRNAPSTKNAGTVGDYLQGGGLPPIATYVKDEDGSLTALYKRDAVQAALESVGACETESAHAERMQQRVANPEPTPKKDASQIKREAAEQAREEAKRKAEDENAFRVALYKKLRKHARDTGLTLDSLREYAKGTLQQNCLNEALHDLYAFDAKSDDAVNAYVDQASAYDIQLLLIDAMLGHSLEVNWWSMQHKDTEDDDFAAVLNMARFEGINPDEVREELFPTPIIVTDLQAADLAPLITLRPGRINEIKAKIIADRPDLVSALEQAANALGYIHGVGGFHLQESKPASADQAEQDQQIAAADVTHVESAPAGNQVVEAAPAVEPAASAAKQRKPSKGKATSAPAPAKASTPAASPQPKAGKAKKATTKAAVEVEAS